MLKNKLNIEFQKGNLTKYQYYIFIIYSHIWVQVNLEELMLPES
jgi:hypothetical protein